MRGNLAGIAVALAALCAPLPAAAQVQTGPAIKLKAPKQPKTKTEKFKGTVVHASRVQITVQSEENPRIVRTFTLSPKMQERMEKLIERGGYQHGDRVTVFYEAAGELATRIRGKPSGPR